MAEWVMTADELRVILDITHESTAGGGLRGLDRLVGKVATLVPFKLCVLLHQRGGDDRASTLRFEFPEGRCSVSPSIQHYLPYFQKLEALHNAFLWCAGSRTAADGDLRILHFIARTGLSYGVAGSADSTDGAGIPSATLIQLDYPPEQFESKQLFFIGIVASHLHAYLVNVATALCVPRTPCALTSKERDVLHWVVEGKTSWEVGRILSMSERTVKFHLRNIYSKLNVANRAQAVTSASRLGLI
jgi:LuxR family transcriptional regulator, quorum-sensing system regulator SolR